MQSYVNAIMSHFEDPEKILEIAVVEMNDDLKKIHLATAEVSCIIFFFTLSFSYNFFFRLFAFFIIIYDIFKVILS